LFKREKEVYEYLLDNEESAIKALERHYKAALDDVRLCIRMMQADEQTQSVIHRINYQKKLEKQLEGIVEKLHMAEYKTIKQYLESSYTDAFVGTMYTLHGQDVPIIAPIDQNAAIKAIQLDTKLTDRKIHASATGELVTLYESLGVDADKLKKVARSEITRGIASGMLYDDIARNVSNTTKAPLSRAKTIVRTEGHRIQQQSAEDARQAAKARGADVVKQWDSTLDGDTRPTHRALDGQIKETNEPFVLGTKKAMHPGDFGDPAEDCNCRCVALTRARKALDAAELATMKERAKFYGLAEDEDKKQTFAEFENKYLSVTQKKGNTVFEWGTIPADLAASYQKTFEMLSEMYPLNKNPIEFVGDFRVNRGYDMQMDIVDLLDDLYAKGENWELIGAQYMPPGVVKGKGAFIEFVDPEISIRTKEEDFRILAEIRKRDGWRSSKDSFYNMAMGSETTMIHEYGHALAYNYGLYGSQETAQELIELFRSYSREEIGKQVSIYAAKNWNEFFAECFVQSFDPKNQSDVSKKVMKILNKRIGIV